LNLKAVHSAGHSVSLQIVPHLADWLSIPTDRTRLVLFDRACACAIAPRDGEERSGQAGGRAWYDRYQHGPDRAIVAT